MIESLQPIGTVVVDGLRIYAHHGVFPQERIVGNMFSVDVHLKCDSAIAMQSDCLDSAVSYVQIVDLVKRVMSEPSNLLENVVYRIVEALKKEFPQSTGGMVAVYKLQPPISSELERVGFVYSW